MLKRKGGGSLKNLFGYAIVHASTICKNSCALCPLAAYKPGIAKLDYLMEIAHYLKSRYLYPIVDVAGKDVTYNPNLVHFLSSCRQLGIITSVTLGTPHSLTNAEEIMRLTNYPRVSFDGPAHVIDNYRGEGNFESFLSLMRACDKARALENLRVVFTAIPGFNVQAEILRQTLEIVRKEGKGKAKLLVNPVNQGGYTEEEWSLLCKFGQQAQVEFSLAKKILSKTDGKKKGCSCQAPEILTFSFDETLVLPCSLLPLETLDIHHKIDSRAIAEAKRIATSICGKHKMCERCWATCYHLPGALLKPDLRLVLAHTLSIPFVQNARDSVLSTAGLLRINPQDRHPHCPHLGNTG